MNPFLYVNMNTFDCEEDYLDALDEAAEAWDAECQKADDEWSDRGLED